MQKPKGLGFSGFVMGSKKPKETSFSRPAATASAAGNKTGLSSQFSSQPKKDKEIYRPTEVIETEMYNPFEPTDGTVSAEPKHSKIPPKPKKKRKS